MPAYLLANVTVTDPDGYAQYRSRVGAVIAQYGGRFLVRGGTVHPQEGDMGFNRCVLVEFPTIEVAQACYDSADYAPLLQLRKDSTLSHVVLIEGVPPA